MTTTSYRKTSGIESLDAGWNDAHWSLVCPRGFSKLKEILVN